MAGRADGREDRSTRIICIPRIMALRSRRRWRLFGRFMGRGGLRMCVLLSFPRILSLPNTTRTFLPIYHNSHIIRSLLSRNRWSLSLPLLEQGFSFPISLSSQKKKNVWTDPPTYSSVYQTTSPPTSRKSTTSKLEPDLSSRVSIKETTMP